MDKRIKLVQKVLKQTRLGRVDWEETANKDQFMVTKGDLSICIRKKEESPISTSFEVEIEILNEDGDTIESFTDFTWMPEANYSILFSELYSMARRYAMGTEEALDELLIRFDDLPF